jgi:serine/threonine protein kinase
VAVKRLLSSDPIEFEKEVSILKALASKPKHPHLITLLATFLHKNKYHLIFPYADANLRKYWDDRPKPAFDQITVLWSLKQMSGIANALSQIHNFTVSHPLSVVGAGELRIQNDVRLSVQKEEQIYGRHGDIKPENVLWFKTAPESEDEHGVLQIADFGLGRFHGRDSRSKVPWEEVLGSPTYEPPECKLHRPVSRAYDIWSLGCLYLEFITWLLKGSADIEGFSDFRGKLAISTQINDDNFFTIVKDSHSELEAVVRKEVVTWVQQLHQHEKCSAVIHDILELIMRDVLLIDSTERIESRNLHQTLETYLEKAIKDNDYLLKPAPKFELSQSNPKNLKVNKGKSVAFSGQEENSASSSAHQSRLPPILLIPRTPSPLGKDKPHHTWPPHGPGIG